MAAAAFAVVQRHADRPLPRRDAVKEPQAGLVERRLAPLELVAPGARRAQVVETLSAWLAEPHRPQAIADRLGVHVGTIRYRLARLRELFGDDLDDPEARFELQLALRASASVTGMPALASDGAGDDSPAGS